jgi:hypothetical protein
MRRTDLRPSTAAVAVALAALGACARLPSHSAPVPSSIDPPTGSAHRPVPVTIRGEGFHVRAVQDVSSGARIESGFRAWLGETALEQVRWVDERTLEAVVPAGIPPGVHGLTLEDPFGRRGIREGAYEATLAPAALGAALVNLPAVVNVGQPFVVTVELANPGAATALRVAVDIGAVGAQPGAPPAPVDVPGGEARQVWRTFTAQAAGEIALSATATGIDALAGGPVSSVPVSASVLAQVPAGLTAWFELAPQVTPGELQLTLAVANAGGAVALDVAPGPLVATGVPVQLGAAPAPVRELAGGATTLFVWPVRLDTMGVLDVSTVVVGVDANDGRPLEVVASASAEVREVALLATDPFGDGTPFAFVTGYGGDLVLGPSRTGTGLVRMAADGTAPRSLSLAFPRDGTGNVSGNKAMAPYRSIGYSGCATDVVDGCGPDNEDGRGLLTSFSFGGAEWLLLAGARASGDLDYVYVTRESGPALAFSYVDLSQLLGPATRGISAARAVGDRVYLGFPDNGGSRPYGLSLLPLPAGTGLGGAGVDAIPGTHALDLQLDEAFRRLVPSASFGAISIVDAIGDLGGRVYFLNDIGCVASNIPAPAVWSDFANCSPSSAAYTRSQSVGPTRLHDLEPWEKAWPQVAVWNGRLYAVRNLVHPTAGRAPQLWSCDPAGGADPAACDPGDWTLVAADASGLTRFGNPNATAATLVVATPTHLYVGFDDAAGGLRIYRTNAATPLTAADFTGAGGCSAADPACPGFGGNGLGDTAGNTRILDAKAISFGGSTLVFVSVGNGSSPVRVHRLPE